MPAASLLPATPVSQFRPVEPDDPRRMSARRRAVVRIALGTAQVGGAVASVLLLLQTGASRPAVWTTAATAVLLLTSFYLFQVRRYGE